MANLGFTIRWADNTADLKRNLEEGLDQIEVTRSAVDKLAQSIGGDKLLRSANAYAAALQKIGGEAGAIGAVERMNSSERQRGIDILTKAIDKYDQLGKKAPSALRDLLAAAQATEKPIQSLARETEAVQRQVERFSGQKLIAEANAMAKAIQQVGGPSKLTQEELKQVAARAQEAATKLTALGRDVPAEIQKLATAAKGAETAVSGLSTRMVAVGAAIGTFLGNVASDALRKVVSGIGEMISRGAEIAPLDGSFKRLTASIGETSKAMLDASRTATAGLIADFDLIQAANKAILLGLPVTADGFADLAKTAVVLGKAMKQDAAKSVDDLTTALGRVSPMILDNLGLTVKVEEANEKYAKSVGKTSDELTESEKKLAFYNAAMEAARARVEDLGGIQLNLADRVRQTQIVFQNLTDSLSVAIAQSPQINAAFATIGDSVQRAFGENQTVQVQRLIAIVEGMTRGLITVAEVGLAVAGGIGRAWSGLQFIFAGTTSVISSVALAFTNLVAGASNIAARIPALGLAFRDLARSSEDTAIYMRGVQQSFHDQAQEALRGIAGNSAFQQTLDGVSSSLSEMRNRMANAAETQASSSAIADRLANRMGNVATAATESSKAIKKADDVQKKWLATVTATTEKMHLTVFALHRFGSALPNVTSAIGDQRDALLAWRPELEGVETAVYDWGAAHDKTIGSLERTMQTLSLMPARVQTAAEAFRNAPQQMSKFTDFLNKDLPNIIVQAFTGGGGLKGALQASGAKLFGPDGPLGFGAGGAMKGLTTKLTNLFGQGFGAALPGLGSLIVPGAIALVNKLKDWITGGPEWKKFQKDIQRDFGVAVSDAVAKALEQDSKKFGRQAAGLINLDDIIQADGGLNTGNVDKYVRKLRDVFSLLQTGALDASQATDILDKNFQGMADVYLSKGPLISRQLVEIVKLTRDAGIESKAVGDFIKNQIDSQILPGLQAFTDASKKASDGLADNKKKLADLNSQLARATDPSEQARLRQEIEATSSSISRQEALIRATGITSERAASALAGSVAVAFSEMQRQGVPILEIADRLEPIVGQLQSQFEAAGFTGGEAFDRIRNLVSLASDEIAGPAIQAATGLGQTLAGLSNIGGLDQDTFSGLTDQIAATFNELTAQGYNSRDILTLMQQPLQTIYELATQFGFAVDEGTQALLDQASSAGVVGSQFQSAGERTAQALDRTNVILEAIAEKLGATIPEAIQNTANAFNEKLPPALNKVKKDIGEIGDVTEEELAQAIRAMERQFAELPGDARDAANRIENELSRIDIPEITIPVAFDMPEGFDPTRNGGFSGYGTSGTPDIEGFANGSQGLRDFGAGTPAILHGREAVVTEGEYRDLMASRVTVADAAPSVTVNLQIDSFMTDGTSVRRVVDEHLVPEIKSALLRDQGGIRRAVKRAANG